MPKAEGDPTRGPQGASPLNASTWGNTLPECRSPAARPGPPTRWTRIAGLLYVPGGNPAPDFARRLAARVESLYWLGRRPRRQDRRLQEPLQARAEGLARLGRLQRARHHHDGRRQEAYVGRAEGRPSLRHRSRDERRALPGAGHANGERGSPFTPGNPVHFCPGSTGGAEWNGPAYDPAEQPHFHRRGRMVHHRYASSLPRRSRRPRRARPGPARRRSIRSTPGARRTRSSDWAGWVTAVDADTGAWKWRAKTNYPIQSGMTPTAGGVVFFGDMGGNFYALDAASGRKLWGQKIGGAVGGGVITYAVNGTQKVAVATVSRKSFGRRRSRPPRCRCSDWSKASRLASPGRSRRRSRAAPRPMTRRAAYDHALAFRTDGFDIAG